MKIWKPKVTPMSELRPQEVKLLPDGSTDLESYVQKTSLAADKPVSHVDIFMNLIFMSFQCGYFYESYFKHKNLCFCQSPNACHNYQLYSKFS